MISGMALYLANQIMQGNLKEEEIYKLFPQYEDEIKEVLEKNNHYMGMIPVE